MNIQTFNATMNNMEVRKVEKLENTFNGKTYVTLQIHFDDEEGNRLIFKDKNVDRESFYKRGMVGTLTLRIIDEPIIKTSTKNTDYQYVSDRISITIEDFKEE